MAPGNPAMLWNGGRIALVLAAALLPRQDPPRRLFDESADPARDIAAAAERARPEDRRVLVVWGANWCSWCRMLDDLSENDPKVRLELLCEYEVVHADLGRLDKNLELAASYGADIARGAGIPYLTFLDAEGKILGSASTAPLELPFRLRDRRRKGYDPAKVLELLVRYRAPRRLAEDAYSAAIAQAKAAGKLLFLSFGAVDSEGSGALRGWLESGLVAPLLARDFAVVRIDVRRTEGGEELLGCVRSDGGSSLPWFAILDRDGRVLASSEGPDGKNIRFPPDEEGIAHVQRMLRRTATGLAERDLDLLGSTLQDLGGPPPEEKPKPAAGEASGG